MSESKSRTSSPPEATSNAEALTANLALDFSFRSATHLKAQLKAVGMTPGSSSTPTMVLVFPNPAWPKQKRHPSCPCTTAPCRGSERAEADTSDWGSEVEKRPSKANILGAETTLLLLSLPVLDGSRRVTCRFFLSITKC